MYYLESSYTLNTKYPINCILTFTVMWDYWDLTLNNLNILNT